MNPELLRQKIDDLKNSNSKDLESIESLMQKRDVFSALSVEERATKENDIKGLDTQIDTLLKTIEERNQEISRTDKLLCLHTNSSMTKRNIVEDLESSNSTNNDAEIRERVTKWFKTGKEEELRGALQTGVDADGGNLLAPQYLVKEIIKELDNQVYIRKYATVLPAITGYKSIGIPTLDKDLDDLTWTTEIGEVTEDKTLKFGKREMSTNQLTKLVLVSKKLIRESNIDIQSFVRDRISYKLSATLEHNYLYGDGNSKPLGIFAQTDDNSSAISTDRDVKIGTSSKDITYDGLVDALSGLKSGYQQGAVWMLNKSAIAALRKIKDANNRPIWQEGIQGNMPSTLLGIPVIQNDFIEDKLEATKYVGFLGNLKHFWILDSISMELQVLHELYSKTNQVGFQVGYWGDGAPVSEEAFVRLLPFDQAYSA